MNDADQLMEKELLDIFNSHFNRDQLIRSINSDPRKFEMVVKIALSDKQPQAWRAAWILGHCMGNNDERISNFVNDFIKVIGTKKEGHQREILKILSKMEIDKEIEGHLFDECMTIWEAIGKSPSVRIVAFRILVKIARKYPELSKELKYITNNQFTSTLSPGARHSFNLLLKKSQKSD